MKKFSTDEGIFDGAIFGARDYREEENIIDYIHEEDRLATIREKEDYFVAEVFQRGKVSWSLIAAWEEISGPSIFTDKQEARSHIELFFKEEPQT